MSRLFGQHTHTQHPPTLSLPLPHTLSRSALCRPRRRHQTLHNFRRPSASAQNAGRPACRLNCSLRLSASLYLSLRPRVSLSTVRLASCSGHTFNQFTLKHQQLHYVTRRRLYVPSSLVHCVVRGEVLPFTRSLASAVPYSRSSHDRVAFLLSRDNFEFQRETLKKN